MKVFLGLGSNLGKRRRNCLRAIEFLQAKGLIIKRTSSFYETEPWGYQNQPRFINMVIEVETELGPDELLKMLKGIERRMGRKDGLRWGPRIIDIDILIYNDRVIDKKDLVIPHPHMHKREFVLRPLSEIAPDLKHPRLGKTVSELLMEITSSSPEGDDTTEERDDVTKAENTKDTTGCP